MQKDDDLREGSSQPVREPEATPTRGFMLGLNVTPGLFEALATLENDARRATETAIREMIQRTDDEFRAKHLPRLIADYHRSRDEA